MEDWQKDIMDAIESNRWQAEDLSGVDVPRAKAKSIPTTDMDFIIDIVYFAARKLKGKKLTPEHEELFNEYDDVLRNQGLRGFHDANVETHANVRDEDTDERDEKYYPNDRLHEDIQKSWIDILKTPFPNHMLNRKARGGRKIRRGSGKGGLFTYSEIDSILEAKVTPLINARYEQEIEKKTRQSIREAKKRLKASGKTLSEDMKDYITRKVTKVLTNQKNNNLYATAYGDYGKTSLGTPKAGKWFSGGLSALGYNPEDEEQISSVLRRVHGIARQYFGSWKSKKEKEEEEDEKVNKMWKDILKEEAWQKRIREREANDPKFRAEQEARRKEQAEWHKELNEHKKKHPFVKDYRYGRCQVNGGKSCIRPLQSPERREYARSEPKGKTCMHCEDDTSKWAHLPEEVWSSPKWKNAEDSEKRKILDSYVKRNNPYDKSKFTASEY